MTDELIPFASKDNVEIYRGNFLVPSDWSSCGVVVHVAGGAGLETGQPVALAITRNSLSLCSSAGPVVSIHFGSVREVKVDDLSGMAIPIRTPSGIVDMVPAKAKGISLKYEFNPMGTQLELILYTLSPRSAYEWVQVIQQAIQNKLSDWGNAGSISHR